MRWVVPHSVGNHKIYSPHKQFHHRAVQHQRIKACFPECTVYFGRNHGAVVIIGCRTYQFMPVLPKLIINYGIHERNLRVAVKLKNIGIHVNGRRVVVSRRVTGTFQPMVGVPFGHQFWVTFGQQFGAGFKKGIANGFRFGADVVPQSGIIWFWVVTVQFFEFLVESACPVVRMSPKTNIVKKGHFNGIPEILAKTFGIHIVGEVYQVSYGGCVHKIDAEVLFMKAVFHHREQHNFPGSGRNLPA